MFRKRSPQIFVVAALGLSAILAYPMAAQAVSFSTDLQISGETNFDEVFAADSFGDVTQTGDFSVVQGGGTTASTYSGATVTGSDPLMGTLTDLGDGFGMTADVDAAYDSANMDVTEFFLALDTTIDLQNTSATDTYKVTFKVNLINNAVNASGSDAFADSEFFVEDPFGEVFFSALISDTVNGNEQGGSGIPGFGGLVSENGMSFFDVTLAPSALATVVSEWVLEGGAFEPGDTATADFSSFLSVDAVMNLTDPQPPQPIPEPSTLLLFGTSLGVLALFRQRFNNNTK